MTDLSIRLYVDHVQKYESILKVELQEHLVYFSVKNPDVLIIVTKIPPIGIMHVKIKAFRELSIRLVIFWQRQDSKTRF